MLPKDEFGDRNPSACQYIGGTGVPFEIWLNCESVVCTNREPSTD